MLLLTIVNPFGIVDWSQQRSRELWERYYAPLYQCAHAEKGVACDAQAPATGRDAMTVVLIDQKSHNDLGGGDNLTGFDIRDVLDLVLRNGISGAAPAPRAIFFDILLGDKSAEGRTADQLMPLSGDARKGCLLRTPDTIPFACLVTRIAELTRYQYPDPANPTKTTGWKGKAECLDNPLAKLRCIRGAGGLPIVIADWRDQARVHSADESMPPGLEALDTVALVAPVEVDVQHYPLVMPATLAERHRVKFRLSPAALLYAIECDGPRHGETAYRPVEREPRTCPTVIDDSTPEKRVAQWSGAFDPALDVAWAIGGGSPFKTELTRTIGPSPACETAEEGRSFARLFRIAVAGVSYADRPQCIYTNTIPFWPLGEGRLGPETLKAILQDKIVMIGGNLAGSSDFVPAAPLGKVPGVYYHAMALDNLIEEGAAYAKQPAEILPPLRMTWQDLRDMLSFVLILALFAGPRLYLERWNGSCDADPDAPTSLDEWLCRAAVFAAPVAFALAATVLVSRQSIFVPATLNIAMATIVILFEVVKLLFVAADPIRRRSVPRHEFFYAMGLARRSSTGPGKSSRAADKGAGHADRDDPDGDGAAAE